MGERSKFRGGDKAPNNGIYIEVGENDHIMGIQDPHQITMKAGDTFPDVSNEDRVWKNKRHVQPK
ncbi:YjzC family protein [Paenibacillus sp. F411]|nr:MULTISPECIES: YjzC family protein [Paenibacillus]MBO2944489.1 YjzC family protein [Paenibacillus sp. F411]